MANMVINFLVMAKVSTREQMNVNKYHNRTFQRFRFTRDIEDKGSFVEDKMCTKMKIITSSAKGQSLVHQFDQRRGSCDFLTKQAKLNMKDKDCLHIMFRRRARRIIKRIMP